MDRPVSPRDVAAVCRRAAAVTKVIHASLDGGRVQKYTASTECTYPTCGFSVKVKGLLVSVMCEECEVVKGVVIHYLTRM